MIIKNDQFELEIFRGSTVYFGSIKNGQTFKKWAEVDDDLKVELESIMKQADSLLKYSERLLFMTANTDINGGRRFGTERRQFIYNGHIPERRSGNGKDRRSGLDRRQKIRTAE